MWFMKTTPYCRADAVKQKILLFPDPSVSHADGPSEI